MAVLSTLIGFILPLGGLIFGTIALHRIETTPNLGGRFLAMTGAAAGLIGTLWSATVALLLLMKAF